MNKSKLPLKLKPVSDESIKSQTEEAENYFLSEPLPTDAGEKNGRGVGLVMLVSLGALFAEFPYQGRLRRRMRLILKRSRQGRGWGRSSIPKLGRWR